MIANEKCHLCKYVGPREPAIIGGVFGTVCPECRGGVAHEVSAVQRSVMLRSKRICTASSDVTSALRPPWGSLLFRWVLAHPEGIAAALYTLWALYAHSLTAAVAVGTSAFCLGGHAGVAVIAGAGFGALDSFIRSRDPRSVYTSTPGDSDAK